MTYSVPNPVTGQQLVLQGHRELFLEEASVLTTPPKAV